MVSLLGTTEQFKDIVLGCTSLVDAIDMFQFDSSTEPKVHNYSAAQYRSNPNNPLNMFKFNGPHATTDAAAIRDWILTCMIAFQWAAGIEDADWVEAIHRKRSHVSGGVA
jgi:hypothetical protein